MRAYVLAFATLALAVGCNNLPHCPQGVPASGSSCGAPGFVCEFGGGAHERCSTISTCSNTQTATWSNASDSMCMNTNASTCSATLLTTPVGQPCPTPSQSCDYMDGRCSCVPCAGGTAGTGSGYAWQCRSWDEGLDPKCAPERPALGSSCNEEGVICRYDDKCTVTFGPDIQCLNQRWQPLTGGSVACATPTCGIGAQ